MPLNLEQTIAQIKGNIDYYKQFTREDQQTLPGFENAIGSVEALEELLEMIEEYNEPFIALKPFTEEEESLFRLE